MHTKSMHTVHRVSLINTLLSTCHLFWIQNKKDLTNPECVIFVVCCLPLPFPIIGGRRLEFFWPKCPHLHKKQYKFWLTRADHSNSAVIAALFESQLRTGDTSSFPPEDSFYGEINIARKLPWGGGGVASALAGLPFFSLNGRFCWPILHPATRGRPLSALTFAATGEREATAATADSAEPVGDYV